MKFSKACNGDVRAHAHARERAHTHARAHTRVQTRTTRGGEGHDKRTPGGPVHIPTSCSLTDHLRPPASRSL
eukprot:1955958-Pleurochrysis_carterae.AAC.1